MLFYKRKKPISVRIATAVCLILKSIPLGTIILVALFLKGGASD